MGSSFTYVCIISENYQFGIRNVCGLFILWILSTLLLYAGSGNHIGTYRQDNCCYVPMLNKKVPLYSRQSQVANILKTPYHGA
jgi:hypothetical protein